MKEISVRSALLCLTLAAATAHAGETEDLAHLQTRWAEVKYQLPEAQQETAFAALAKEAQAAHQAHPGSAAILAWEGIVRATYAGAKGGLGALGEAKKAKALFEQSIRLDPTALSGSAYTSLGSLYYQVPGWPIGFGNDDKARDMLQKGLEIDPDGIDSNFFYGDFLFEEGDYEPALAAFEKALKASPRPGRESADAGRRAEIERKIAETRSKI
jgi:tetratricopeptide (TPR) repeat protein